MKRTSLYVIISVLIISLLGLTVFAEPGFAYGEDTLSNFAPGWESIVSDNSVISLTPGAQQGELRFAWLSDESEAEPSFIISENSDMSDCKECEIVKSDAIDSYISNNVTVTGLEEGKTYYYSYTKSGEWSTPAPVTIQSDETFTVLFVSDAQIGRSGDENLEEILIRDTCGWNYTVEKMLAKYPDAAFAISSGDQFQSADSLTQMKAYLSPAPLRSLPIANTIGNHDYDATLYGDIFNNPNEVFELFASKAGTGYYYVYGDALFITINSNNTSLTDTARVLRKATEAHPDAKWRVVTMHHNPYSASHGDDHFSDRRLLFSSLFDCYDIDICLSGHDHIYSRTSAMYAGKTAETEGTVYMQSSSASGSNYDSLPSELASALVTAFDERVPTYSALTFSAEQLTVVTYRTDTNEVIDEFEVNDNTNNSSDNIFAVLTSIFRTLFSMI